MNNQDDEINIKIGKEDEEVKTWPGAVASIAQVVGFVLMIAIFAQCESGRIW